MKFRFTLSIIALVAGCATMPQTTPQLNQAQQTYSQARSDPMIVRYAPVPLHEAGQTLSKAENAESDAESNHYAYLTEKKVELARTLAAENAAEDQVKDLSAQRENILLQTRSSEAKQARLEAREAQEELGAYRSEQEQQEATRTRMEAEKNRAEIQQLKQEITDLEARETDRGILLTMGGVLFETDKAELKPGAELFAGKLADFLKEHPDRQILVEGHTDSRGPDDYNRQLSQMRADAVAGALQARGIRADRITARGLGESYPIAPNTTAAGRQQNRRVEIIIKNQGQ